MEYLLNELGRVHVFGEFMCTKEYILAIRVVGQYLDEGLFHASTHVQFIVLVLEQSDNVVDSAMVDHEVEYLGIDLVEHEHFISVLWSLSVLVEQLDGSIQQ